MGVTSVSLPKWKGKDTMSDSQIGSYDKSALKTKKVTEYAKAVNGNYKSLRNITTNLHVESSFDPQKNTRLRTSNRNDPKDVYVIGESGTIESRLTHRPTALRPVIEY